MERVAEDVDFYTVGYEGRVIEDFVEELVRSEIEVLVDVREMPASRSRGSRNPGCPSGWRKKA